MADLENTKPIQQEFPDFGLATTYLRMLTNESETDGDTKRELSDAEIADVLNRHRTVDTLGVAPGEDGWNPTYDMNGAAADVWLIKAARLSEAIETPTTGPITAKKFDNAMQMATRFSGRRAMTVTTAPRTQTTTT